MVHSVVTQVIDADIGTWKMTEAQASPDLADCVDTFWEGHGELPPFTEKILPRPTVELMFNLGNPHRVLALDGKSCDEPYEYGWLSGMQQRYLTVHTPHGSHLLAISLKPFCAWRLLRLPMRQVARRVPLMGDIWGLSMDVLQEKLHEADTPTVRFALLEQWLREQLDRTLSIPAWLSPALTKLESSQGQVSIQALSRSLDISRSLVHRCFREYVGIGPKAYARVCRFNALVQHSADNYQSWLDQADNLGFYDDPHLYREFRDIAGTTPRAFWQSQIAGQIAGEGAILI